MEIWTWMDGNAYPAANSKETIFIKWEGDGFIIHDLQTASTSQTLMDKFLE